VITLLPGTHLTGQLSLALDKRVALRARGGGVVLDHRRGPAAAGPNCTCLRPLHGRQRVGQTDSPAPQ
jgi:hypothetical protein